VFIMDVGGMHLLNDREFIAANVTGTTIELTDPYSGTNIDTTAMSAYTSGGTVHQVHAGSQQPAFHIANNVITGREACVDISGVNGCYVCENDLTNFGNALYNRRTYAAFTITGITQANPGVVTYTGADPSNNEWVFITGVVGMTEVNNRAFKVANVNAGANTFELSGENTNPHTAYVSGGQFTLVGAATHVWLKNYRESFIANNTHTSDVGGGVNVYLDAIGTGAQALDAAIFGGHFSTNSATNAIKVTAGNTRTTILHPYIVHDRYTLPIDDATAQASTGTMMFVPRGVDNEEYDMRYTAENATRNPKLNLYRDSFTPAANDLLGAVQFIGNDAGLERTNYGAIEGRIDDPTAGSEDGGLNIYAMTAGTETKVSHLSSTAWTTTLPFTVLSGTAAPAGGTTGSGIKLSSVANFGIFFGSGVPTLSAAQGSLYLRRDGSSTSTRAYINTDGGTTWTSITTAA
jgi:hypothetical protein